MSAGGNQRFIQHGEIITLKPRELLIEFSD